MFAANLNLNCKALKGCSLGEFRIICDDDLQTIRLKFACKDGIEEMLLSYGGPREGPSFYSEIRDSKMFPLLLTNVLPGVIHTCSERERVGPECARQASNTPHRLGLFGPWAGLELTACCRCSWKCFSLGRAWSPWMSMTTFTPMPRVSMYAPAQQSLLAATP